MPPSIPARINPIVLAWARRKSGYPVEAIARRLRVSADRVMAWEQGASLPTIAQTRKLAALFRRPLAFFFLPEPPRDFQVMQDFRRLPGAQELPFSPELSLAIREVVERRQAALGILELLEVEAPSFAFQASLSQEPDAVAQSIRNDLGVKRETRRRWQTIYDALNHWLDAIESCGVLVSHVQGIALDQMRGFSISADHLPAIALNQRDAPAARIFSLLHEFTHLALQSSGVCNLEERHDSVEARQIEIFCNKVAAAALMPADELLSHDVIRAQPRTHVAWSDSDLHRLANTFKVSREAVLVRLLDLGRTSYDFYLYRRRRFLQEYEERRLDDEQREDFHPGPYWRRLLRRHGRLYAQLVLDAYHGRHLTLHDACVLLDTKVRHVERLSEAVFS